MGCTHKLKKLEIDVTYGIWASCESCGTLFQPIWRPAKLSSKTKKKIRKLIK